MATNILKVYSRTISSFSSSQLRIKCSKQILTLPVMRSMTSKPYDRKVPINWLSVGLLTIAGGGVVLYVQKLRTEKELVAEKKRTQSLGKAALGGPFKLTDYNGVVRTDKDFHGQWVLIYFGFTFCPDICPDELEKMGTVINKLDNTEGLPKIQPLFITVDPQRDTCSVLKSYLKDFHPRIIGLTGEEEHIHQATKAYRVYYSRGPTDDDNDYLVDHTIIMYLVNPEGDFVNYYGQNKKADEMATGIANEIIKYNRSR